MTMRVVRSLADVDAAAPGRELDRVGDEVPQDLLDARRIEQQLRTKGIAQPLAREALREVFAEADEEALARRLLAKRFRGQDLKEPKVRHRAVAMLQRRGFSAKIIFDLLQYSIDED